MPSANRLLAEGIGTAVFADGWALQQLWLFWVAPILGGALAGVVYPFLAGSPASNPTKREAKASR